MGLKYNSLEHLVRPIQPFEDLKAIFELGKKINKLDPDVVALHSAKAGVLGRIACWWDETPCVVTAHGWAFTEGKSRLRRHFLAAVERLVAPLAERIITVSDFDQKLAADWKVSSPEKMITIYNGVHDLRQKKVMSDEFNETPRIIMVARFELQKDQLTLLRALKKLRGVPWEAWFVGDGPRLEQCVDLARDLDIDDSVRFLGYRSDVPDLLAQSDIFVLSTHYEGFPIATVEAMRAGLPIVASDVGGVSEQVRSGKNGFLVPPEDVGELKRALEDLLQNKETRQEMGMAGRQMFCEQFRVEKMVDRTLEVYKEATRQGKQ
jgi:glycosyltransferase involved in cell wall biosynthesis